jgi:predicted permease
MSTLLLDLRYALRALRRHPASTLVIIASLAIGIGANAAIFSVVNALLLKPLPYPDPDRLAALWLRSPGINIPQDWPSPGQYVDLRQESRSFEALSISRGRGSVSLIRHDRPERVQALETSSNLFTMLGAQPLHGRLLLPDEDVPGKAQVVVLSHAFWTRMFAADPGVVGTSIILNGLRTGSGDDKNQFTVVGILSPDFLLNNEVMQTVASLEQLDVFLPLPLGADAVTRRGDENFNLMARVKRGVTMAQAQADVDMIAARIREKDKRDRTFTISVVPLRDQVVGDVRRAVLVLLGSVTLVLLIACANVANLLLSRASGRQKEVAIRTALGASWRQVVGQLLTESILLGLLGGAAGLLLAHASLLVMRALNPGNIPRLDAITIDPTVLAFTFGVSLATGIIFGLAPALRTANVDLTTALKAGGRSGQGDGGFGSTRLRLRSLLVVSELALALMLLIGAGLLVRSFARLQDVPPGFNPDRVVSMRVGSSGRQFATPAAGAEFFRQIGDRLAAVPGVTARGAVSSLPLTTSVGWGSINVEGFQPSPGQELQVDTRGVSPDYFKTMEIPIVKGRGFTSFDTTPDAQQVAIIDEQFARRFWPNGDPIGRQLWFDPKRRMSIIGVVGTVKQYGLDIDGRIVVYRATESLLNYQVARTASSEPASVAAAMARAIHEVDPTIPVYDVRTMNDRLYESMARQRFATLMLGAFAAFALLLAVIGVYGVMSYLVAQGRHEIGVRMALGAPRRRILAMVVRQGLELTGAGAVLGLIGALGLTRVMESLLFGIGARDLTTFALVPILLMTVGMVACLIPARRAATVDPQIALRVD